MAEKSLLLFLSVLFTVIAHGCYGAPVVTLGALDDGGNARPCMNAAFAYLNATLTTQFAPIIFDTTANTEKAKNYSRIIMQAGSIGIVGPWYVENLIVEKSKVFFHGKRCCRNCCRVQLSNYFLRCHC